MAAKRSQPAATRSTPAPAGPRSARTRPALAALGLLLLGPIVILPGGLDRFVLIKVAAVAAGGCLGLLVPRAGRLPRSATVLVCLGAGVLLAAAAFGAQPMAQVLGREPRLEGAFVLAAYVLAAVAGARLLGPGRGGDVDTMVIRLLTIAAVVVAVLGLLEALGWTPLTSSTSRPGSLLGNASDEGAWAVLVLGPLVAYALRRRDPWSLVGSAAALLAIAASGSRGALVGGLVVLAVLALLSRERRASLLCLAAALGMGAVGLLLPATRVRLDGADSLAAATVPGRGLLWSETLSLLGRHPLLGLGPGGFSDAIPALHDERWYVTTGSAVPPDSPHSWPLQALSAGGPVLLVLALLLGGLTLAKGWHTASDALLVGEARAPAGLLAAGLLAGLAGYGTALLVHLTSPGPTAAAAFFGGALLSMPVSDEDDPRLSRRWRGVAPALAGALAVVLFLGALAEIPLRQAIIRADAGDLAGADAAFATASRLRPWDPDLGAAAGHAFAVLASAGSTAAASRATPWLTVASAQLPRSVPVMIDQASVAEASGDFATAARLLATAQVADPYNPQILLRRGVVAAEQADYPAAEEFLLRAADLSPQSPEPWDDLARLYTLQGRTAEAAGATAKAAGLRRLG